MPISPFGLINEPSGSSFVNRTAPQMASSVHESAAPTLNSMRERRESFFVETLNFLSEMNTEFYENNRLFYCSLVEAGTECELSVIHESFGDFFDGVKKIIDKFLAFIKSLFDRFVTLINKMIGRDKYILNHKKDFDNFKTIHEFTIDGFEFTIFPHIPVIEAQAEFSNDFIFNLAGSEAGDNIFNNTNPRLEEIKALVTTLTNNLDGQWYDEFRGKVINSDQMITKDDFADELFTVFRNDQSIKDEITVDHSVVSAALKRFIDAKTDIEKAKRTKAKIDSDYQTIRKKVEKLIVANRSGNTIAYSFATGLTASKGFIITPEMTLALDNYAKAKSNQIQEMSSIHALAFAAKLDALTDCYKQDKDLLFKALSRVQSNKKED